MARPSDITSKPVATRLPMSDYIKFLQEATENNMSMSDFLLVKIYAEKTIFKHGGNIEETSALKTEISNLKLENEAHAKENKALRASACELHKLGKQEQAEKKKLSDELALLKSKGTNTESHKKEMAELLEFKRKYEDLFNDKWRTSKIKEQEELLRFQSKTISDLKEQIAKLKK